MLTPPTPPSLCSELWKQSYKRAAIQQTRTRRSYAKERKPIAALLLGQISDRAAIESLLPSLRNPCAAKSYDTDINTSAIRDRVSDWDSTSRQEARAYCCVGIVQIGVGKVLEILPFCLLRTCGIVYLYMYIHRYPIPFVSSNVNVFCNASFALKVGFIYIHVYVRA